METQELCKNIEGRPGNAGPCGHDLLAAFFNDGRSDPVQGAQVEQRGKKGHFRCEDTQHEDEDYAQEKTAPQDFAPERLVYVKIDSKRRDRDCPHERAQRHYGDGRRAHFVRKQQQLGLKRLSDENQTQREPKERTPFCPQRSRFRERFGTHENTTDSPAAHNPAKQKLKRWMQRRARTQHRAGNTAGHAPRDAAPDRADVFPLDTEN